MDVVAPAVLMPFAGTLLGAAFVFFLRNGLSAGPRKALTGFAAGVMTAASSWSLMLPAMESCAEMGRLAFLPATAGFLAGVAFLLALDVVVPHMHADRRVEGPKVGLGRTAKLFLAVTLHNVPEGMAVGVVCAGFLSGEAGVGAAAVLALAAGIALQNVPEGTIVSAPLAAEGMRRRDAFLFGAASGAVEPVAAVLAALAAERVSFAMPGVLAFAAGAMLYVVVEELVPELSEGAHSNVGTVAFSVGFAAMTALDRMAG